jgi:hypothetical protein
MGRSVVDRLEALRESPAERIAYALKVLRARKNGQEVILAARALATTDGTEGQAAAVRPVVLESYRYYAADPVHRDPSSPVRIALIGALHPVARVEDIPLLEAAASAYERIPPGFWEEAGGMRAAALVVLAHLDRDLAAYHAARLLSEDSTTLSGMMSGEPAQTAIRVLVAQGHLLPVYGYVVGQRAGVAEAISEGLRHLTHLAPSLIAPLIEKYRTAENDIVLGGLLDLLIAHESRGFVAEIRDLLATAPSLPIYRYAVTALIATRRPDLLAVLIAAAENTPDPRRAAALADGLGLLIGHAEAEAARQKLLKRL